MAEDIKSLSDSTSPSSSSSSSLLLIKNLDNGSFVPLSSVQQEVDAHPPPPFQSPDWSGSVFAGSAVKVPHVASASAPTSASVLVPPPPAPPRKRIPRSALTKLTTSDLLPGDLLVVQGRSLVSLSQSLLQSFTGEYSQQGCLDHIYTLKSRHASSRMSFSQGDTSSSQLHHHRHPSQSSNNNNNNNSKETKTQSDRHSRPPLSSSSLETNTRTRASSSSVSSSLPPPPPSPPPRAAAAPVSSSFVPMSSVPSATSSISGMFSSWLSVFQSSAPSSPPDSFSNSSSNSSSKGSAVGKPVSSVYAEDMENCKATVFRLTHPRFNRIRYCVAREAEAFVAKVQYSHALSLTSIFKNPRCNQRVQFRSLPTLMGPSVRLKSDLNAYLRLQAQQAQQAQQPQQAQQAQQPQQAPSDTTIANNDNTNTTTVTNNDNTTADAAPAPASATKTQTRNVLIDSSVSVSVAKTQVPFYVRPSRVLDWVFESSPSNNEKRNQSDSSAEVDSKTHNSSSSRSSTTAAADSDSSSLSASTASTEDEEKEEDVFYTFCTDFVVKCYQSVLSKLGLDSQRRFQRIVDVDGEACTPMCLEGFLRKNALRYSDWELVGVVDFVYVE